MMVRRRLRVLVGAVLGLILWLTPGVASSAKLILALGDSSYLPPETVMGWTGAEVKTDLGENELLEFAVVVLSNIAYPMLPAPVQEGLAEYLGRGGSVLVSGGANGYGSGGYGAVAHLLPFEIRAPQDWRAGPFKPVLPLQPGHPILGGVTFQSIGTFNDLNPRPGATELAQYAGGGTVSGARFASPLIAERQVGQGTVVGVAFDLGQEVRSGWPDGSRFLENVLTYLVARSPLEPEEKEEKETPAQEQRPAVEKAPEKETEKEEK